jgi:flagellar biosynthetic protein FliR
MDLGLSPVSLIAGLLIFVRVLGIFSVAPIFGHARLPAQVKVGLAFLLSMILIPIVRPPDPTLANAVLLLGAAVVKELVVGLIIGYVTTLLFLAVQLAGEAIDMQMGFGLASTADPLLGTHTSIIGQFLYLIATLLFLALNGHHLLLTGLVKSFDLVPLNHFVFGTLLSGRVLDMVSEFFLIGLRIGGPVMLAVFLADLVVGLLGRTLPQMNLLVVGFPVKVWVGLGILTLTLPLILLTCQGLFTGMYRDMLLILDAMK